MSFSYPKIWACILTEPWFVNYTLSARGLYLQLLLIAKNGADNGQLCFRSSAELAQMCGTHSANLLRFLKEFQKDGKIIIEENRRNRFRIKISNYDKWQEITPKEVKACMTRDDSDKSPGLLQSPKTQMSNKLNNKINKTESIPVSEMPSSRKEHRSHEHDSNFDYLEEEEREDEYDDPDLRMLANPLLIPLPPIDPALEGELRPPMNFNDWRNMNNISIDSLAAPSDIWRINTVFGKITDYIIEKPDGSMELDPKFEAEHIVMAKLPFPIPLAWDNSIEIAEFRCHQLLQKRFETIFQKIMNDGLKDLIHTFGGCFQFRLKRDGTGFSTHSWGIAIDINPDSNKQGISGDMDKRIVSILKDAGFFWGGEWNGRVCDPMHFQYCTGY